MSTLFTEDSLQLALSFPASPLLRWHGQNHRCIIKMDIRPPDRSPGASTSRRLQKRRMRRICLSFGQRILLKSISRTGISTKSTLRVMRGDKGIHFFHSVELDKQCHGEPLASNQFVIDATTRDDKRYKSQNQKVEQLTFMPPMNI